MLSVLWFGLDPSNNVIKMLWCIKVIASVKHVLARKFWKSRCDFLYYKWISDPICSGLSAPISKLHMSIRVGIRWMVALFLDKNICCGYSLEVPQWGTSNEYPQHMFSSRDKKNIDTFWLKQNTLSRAKVNTEQKNNPVYNRYTVIILSSQTDRHEQTE